MTDYESCMLTVIICVQMIVYLLCREYYSIISYEKHPLEDLTMLECGSEIKNLIKPENLVECISPHIVSVGIIHTSTQRLLHIHCNEC